jgi:hypothetical protein
MHCVYLQVIAATFPILLRLWTGLLSNPAAEPLQLAEFQKLICKIFWSATFMGMPDIVVTEEGFNGWMGCLHQAVTRPIPWVSEWWRVCGGCVGV